MSRLLPLAGCMFGSLLVIKFAGYKQYGKRKLTAWLCKCSCGKETVVVGQMLRNGNTSSCGCSFWIRPRSNNSITTATKKHHTHARKGKRSPTYISWQAMLTRCRNSKHKNWFCYGGRGIKVCDRWLNSFENFLIDMGERLPGMTLDRIDVNGNYEPSNCRWATHANQQENKRLRKYGS